MSYHLWIKPTGNAYTCLATAIVALADRFHAPIFEPHLTLLGGLIGPEEEHVARAEHLVRQLGPFQITLTEPSSGEDYFQCVFMKAAPTATLMAVNAQARQVFQQPAPSLYLPHVSLLYGHYPSATKERIVADLNPQLRMSFEARSLTLIRADSDGPKDWHEFWHRPLDGEASAQDAARKE